MANGDVATAWSGYRSAIEQIYRLDAETIVQGEARLVEPPDGQLLERALIRSDELRAVIIAELLSGDSSSRQRELAMTQLGAAATIDLSIADDLARLEPEETDDREAAEAYDPAGIQTFAAAVLVLEASAEDPWDRILAGGAEPPAGARVALTSEAQSATEAIIDEVQKVVMSAAGGFIGGVAVNVAMAPGAAAEYAFHEVRRRVGWLRRAAVNFVLSAVRKLFALLGVNAASVHDRVGAFIEPQIPDVVRNALAALYDSASIERELVYRIEHARTDLEMGAAVVELAGLRRRFAKNMEVTDGAVRALDKVKRWLLHIAPPTAISQ